MVVFEFFDVSNLFGCVQNIKLKKNKNWIKTCKEEILAAMFSLELRIYLFEWRFAREYSNNQFELLVT